MTKNKIENSSGSKYEGQLKNGKRQGHGVLTYSNGNKYEGEWKNGLQEGRGVLIF